MRAAVLLWAVLLGQGYYTPEEAADLFAQANEAYYRQDPAGARAGYEKLLAHGFGGPDVLYNLGTVHLAEGDIGRAVLAFERARRAGGNADDLEANLAQARARQVDKVVGAGGEEEFLTRLVAATDGHAVAWAFLGLWLGGFGLLLLRRLLPVGRRGWAAVLGALALALALPAGALLGAHAWVQRRVSEAVVLAPTLRAHEFPGEEARVSFEVHAGLKVRLLEEAGRFVRIRLPNGLEGWAERSGVEAINAPAPSGSGQG